MTPDNGMLGEIKALYQRRREAARGYKAARLESHTAQEKIRAFREQHGLTTMQFCRLARGVIKGTRS